MLAMFRQLKGLGHCRRHANQIARKPSKQKRQATFACASLRPEVIMTLPWEEGFS
jgi:hypothetical protein